MSWEFVSYQINQCLYHFTPAILALMPGLGVAWWARRRLKAALRQGEEPISVPGMTGEQAARLILQTADVEGVNVVAATGPLANFYDRGRETLRLSATVFHGQSTALVALASHQAGHVLQPAWCSAARTVTTFATGLATSAAWLLLAAGVLFTFDFMAQVGGLIFSAAVLVSLLMTPLEIAANRKVRRAMTSTDLAGVEESPSFRQALTAAAFARVAAMLPLRAVC